jgi:hypothetical protein
MENMNEKLIEANAKILALETELSAFKNGTHSTMIESNNALVAIAAERAMLSKALTETESKLAESSKTVFEQAKKLRDPAYIMASARGDDTPIPEGGGAKDAGTMTSAQALREYRKLDGNPKAQKAFRVAHWQVLGCDEETN